MPTGKEHTYSLEADLAAGLLTRHPQAVLIDLDDTIYWEGDYWESVLDALPESLTPWVSRSEGERLASLIMNAYRGGPRRGIFQRSIKRAGLPRNVLESILYEFRTHTVAQGLKPRKWLVDWIDNFEGPIGIVSNGDAIIQRNKLRNLDCSEKIFNAEAVLTDQYPPKPNPLGSRALLEKWGIPPQNCLFVGDSIQDRLCASNLGVPFCNSIPWRE